MAVRVPLHLHEGNDETLLLTITPEIATEDLTGIVSLRLYLKPEGCTGDDGLGVLVLTTADPAQLTIDSQTAHQITATAYIPATALAGSYDRVWRVDAYGTATHRTAMFGPVTVEPL